ncbi:hypothetical protein GCM10009678_45270 [Actinomadura kijaniata]|uniref:Anti-anti-sigma factor n=1 Tax=Actinomadura namibiensis TaxID=182080 RepID=A0A7W3LKI3_ACTNM|nr:STAS domain-containing protein [Actinomadura namibiensis]MBA8949818.1 anti-anti-sigma factor [Actinomadura namibiensis]
MGDTAVVMDVTDHHDHIGVLMRGELDRLTCPAVRARLRALVEAAARPLVLDLAGVTFLDAAGLRLVESTARYCAERGTGLAVTGVRPFTVKMFRLLRLHERVPLCSSRQEALWCLIPPTDAQIRAWLDGT